MGELIRLISLAMLQLTVGMEWTVPHERWVSDGSSYRSVF